MKYIFTGGELGKRIKKNIERLKSSEYCTPEIFIGKNDWPGDWEGRTLLALCMNFQSTHEQNLKVQIMSQIQDIVDGLDGVINEHGYFGKIFENGNANEQQLSGNSWFLRAMCEYYNITNNPKVMKILRNIIDNYLLKLADYYQKYPIIADREIGGVGGHLISKNGTGWMLSSDVGCAFIMLDGITNVYELTKESKLVPVIESIIKRFNNIDVIESKCQTHAVLSFVRGLLRYYKITGDKKHLNNAIEIFNIYRNNGMTLNYANYNWFTLPKWTETCAIVDSAMVAMQLYEYTQCFDYLIFINRLYLNAIRTAQRDCGGAGCETCATSESPEIKMFMYEAFFCCTMRIAEGLNALVNFQLIRNGNNLIIPFHSSFEAKIDDAIIKVVTKGTCGHKQIEINITDISKIKSLKIYIPKNSRVRCSEKYSQTDGFIIIYNFKKTVFLDITFEPVKERLLNSDIYTLGDILLARRNINATGECYHINGQDYYPLINMMELSKEEIENIVQIL